MTREEAIDITEEEAQKLLVAAGNRKKFEAENNAIILSNSIGRMLFGDGKKGSSPAYSGSGGQVDNPSSSFWKGGRTTTKPDLSPNPKRPRLKELAEMEPIPLDIMALQKLGQIKQTR